MRQQTTGLEVLLMSNSHYLNRDWSEVKGNSSDKQQSKREKLILLCWNGMLSEIMPEILQTVPGKKPLTLWEINESGNMLDLRYGNIDEELNDEWSINPYVYLTFANPN